jgi:hypothetical protein
VEDPEEEEKGDEDELEDREIEVDEEAAANLEEKLGMFAKSTD